MTPPGPAAPTPAGPAGPAVTAKGVLFRLPDPDRRLDAARLLPALALSEPGVGDPGVGDPALGGSSSGGPSSADSALDFEAVEGGWTLWLPRPPVLRMEYRLAVRYAGGGTEEICDPGNPQRAPGAFGDKSVVEFPGYRAPAWLAAPRPAGVTLELAVPSRHLGRDVAVGVWSPAGTEPAEPLPLLVAHDGPEYDRLASLSGYAATMGAGPLPPLRLALLAPGDRDEEYSANPAYARALAREVLPAIRRVVGVRGPVVGMGASLGGLAMLHTQRRHPAVLGGLFLQSASFLDRRLDPQEEARFDRFGRVAAFVAGVLREPPPYQPVPVALTCGRAEENLANNRRMAAALQAQGYPATLAEVPDAHNYVAWRDAFHPTLTDLLGALWVG